MQTFKGFIAEALVPLSTLGLTVDVPKKAIKDKQGNDVIAIVTGKRGGKYHLVAHVSNGKPIIQAFRSADFESHHGSTSPTDMVFPVAISGYHYFITNKDGIFASRTPYAAA